MKGPACLSYPICSEEKKKNKDLVQETKVRQPRDFLGVQDRPAWAGGLPSILTFHILNIL